MSELAGHQRGRADGLVVAGYLTAVLFPIVGFFLGLALVIKDRIVHGVIVMILSVLVFFAAWSYIAGDIASSTSGGADQLPAATPWCNPANDVEDDC